VPVLTSGEVRRYLAGLALGSVGTLDPASFDMLVSRGAVSGSISAPTLTPVGKHVLGELEVRAYRADSMSLDSVAEQLTRVLNDLDNVAKTAEYFLAELGPVTPPEALPMLRPVAVGLANRRETPEELAEEFRNVWGSVEVMGGDPRDRLLAAALLHAGGADIEHIYSPMMTTSASVREIAGPRAPAVTVAALLHLNPGPDDKPAWDSYVALRKSTRTEEGAAMLAATGRPVEELLANRTGFLGAIAGSGTPSGDQQVAAGFLTTAGASRDTHMPRVTELSKSLGNRFSAPIVAASVLGMLDWLSPAELVNWLDKASDLARSRKLAPTPAELAALGLTIVLGLPPSEFATSSALQIPPLRHFANIVAVNAWVYGQLVPVGTSARAVAPP
jgi:hypothetical protein